MEKRPIMATHDGKEQPTQIRVRYFRSSDGPRVRDLFYASMTGDDSALTLSMRRQWTTPTSFLCYFIIVSGIVLGVFYPLIHSINIFLGCALVGGGLVMFAVSRHRMYRLSVDYIRDSIEGDLSHIEDVYGMKSKDPLLPNLLEPVGKGGFWVAESYRPGEKPVVVGCIGSDMNTEHSNATTCELRRVLVAQDHRRQGIAKLLIRALVDHARKEGVRTLFLRTTEYQFAAMNMYEKAGWKFKDSLSLKTLLWETFVLLDFVMEVDECNL